tara:strand:- start:512 stop:706 length:195 start_codon:yes stop_codon:yes gene_type:complete
VEISKVSPTGECVIGYIGAGEIFGEMAPIDEEPRMASARALRDTVRDLLQVLVQALRSVSDRLN